MTDSQQPHRAEIPNSNVEGTGKPKSEIRNPKSETNLNVQNPKFKTDPPTSAGVWGPVSATRAWNFGFVSDFEFRISSFRPPAGVWIGLIVLGVLATAASYLLLDPMVSTWFLNHPSTWHQNVWVDAFRQLGKAGTPIWLLVVWSCLTDKWRPTILTVAALILVGVSVCPLKAISRRCRPHPVTAASPQDENISWQKKVSFPSGDTAVVFAAATTLSFSLGSLWAPALFVAAGAVGLLRVTVSAHYPSDVLAGAMIGVLCGMAAMRWMAHRRELDQFHVQGRWRLIAVLVLVLVIPFVSPYIGMWSLQVFLKVYIIPLAVLVLVYLSASRLRAWRVSTRPVALRAAEPKSDSLKEPTP